VDDIIVKSTKAESLCEVQPLEV
jgi:hypothetical protein